MPGNQQASSVYIGNLDEKVDERVLYEIMIQAGPLVDLHMPRNKETKRHKGYAFAEFTTEESAQYAVKLFSGLVHIHKKLLRVSISGQDNPLQPTPQDYTIKRSDRSLVDCSIQYPEKQPHNPSCSPSVGYSSSPLDVLRKGPFPGYPRAPARSGLTGEGLRLDFSPLAYAQNYNARLVSLGQSGLQSHPHSTDQSSAYRLC